MKSLTIAGIAGAVIPIVKPEIVKLRRAIQDDLVQRYNSVNGIKDELVALTDQLSSIQSWVEKLDQIIWPCDDMLDWSRRATEIRYEVDHYISEFLCEENSCTRDFIIKRELIDHVKDLKRRLKILAKDYVSSEWDQLATSNMIDGLGCRVSSILSQDHEDLLGFQGKLGDLTNLLQLSDASGSLKIISIAGSGGSGKTALALEAFTSVGEKFQSFASVCVSGCVDTRSLLMDLYMQVGGSDLSDGDIQTNHLIRKISALLATKRYLILLDDLWRTGMWETLKPAFPNNKKGSRIVLTTRLNSVALICSKKKELVLKMSPLEDEESRKLFLGTIYGRDNCPPQFESNMGIILKKCGGIPLLILRMAGHILERGPMRIDAWEEISSDLNCFRECSQSESLHSLNQSLFLSYTLLPRHLKECALFLSGFPGGSTVDIDVVISSWIAEDLVASRSGGAANVDELINQHLMEPVHIAADGKVGSVRVPRLVQDMLAKASYDKGFYTSASRPVTRLDKMRLNRLSLASENVSFIADSNVISHHTRTMILRSCRGVPNLATCKFLRLLLIHQCHDLSNANLKSIAELVYLKAVILNTPSITELPRHIHKLQMLESLIICGSSVTKMPNSIIKLQLLTCLKVGAVAFPPGIARLQKLEKLEIFDIGSSAEEAVRELGELQNLKILTCHWGLGTNTVKDDARASNFVASLGDLATKGKLEELMLKGGNNSLIISLSYFRFDLMPKLQKLCVEKKCFLTHLPSHMSDHWKLTHLSISLADLNVEYVVALGGLPFLTLLKLWINCPVSIEFAKGKFLQLHSLLVSSNALELKFKRGCLPKLEKLHMITTNEVRIFDLDVVSSLNALFVNIVGAGANVANAITTAVKEATVGRERVRVIITSEMKIDDADPLFGEEV